MWRGLVNVQKLRFLGDSECTRFGWCADALVIGLPRGSLTGPLTLFKAGHCPSPRHSTRDNSLAVTVAGRGKYRRRSAGHVFRSRIVERFGHIDLVRSRIRHADFLEIL